MADLLSRYPHLDAHVMRAAERMTRAGLDERTADKIFVGIKSDEEWPGAWEAAGKDWEQEALAAVDARHPVTAREFYRQAFFCYRLADFYYTEDTENKTRVYLATLRTFAEAVRGVALPPEPIEVPYNGVKMPGYIVRAANRSGRTPAVLHIYGADGCKEEQYWNTALHFSARGVACMIVDLPGGGAARRLLKLNARFDYEVPARAALEVLLSQRDIDPDRIGLSGSSMGGYYAPRVFAREPRFKACVVNSALTDVMCLWDFYPPIRPQLIYNIGAASAAEATTAYQAFNLQELLPKVDRPLAIHHGGNDRLIPVSEAQKMHELLGGPKELVVWPGGSHNCGSVIAKARPAFTDWLVDHI